MKKQSQFVYDVRNIATIRELLHSSVDLFREEPAFARSPDGVEVVTITYGELLEDVKALATYLRTLVPAGSKIGVTGKNSYHWALTYLAVTCGVGIIVPIDKDLRGEEIAGLVKDSETTLLV